ncbi:MAG: hypothetical protein AAF546_03120 [Verrucomicrobiota bacterium]
MKWIPLVSALCIGALVGFFAAGGKNRTESQASDFSSDSWTTTRDLTKIKSGPKDTDTNSLESGQTEPQSIKVENFIQSLDRKTSFEEFGELHALLENATATDFGALVNTFKAQGSSANWTVLNLIAMRWAEMDPQSMFDYVSNENNRDAYGIRNALFRAWARSDSRSAIAAASQLESRNLKQNAFQTILGVIAGNNPEQALTILKTETDLNTQGGWVYENVFSQWAARDPEEARRAALSLPDGQAKVRALSGALGEWISRDAAGALEWLDALPRDSTSYYARREIFRDIVRQNFDAAREYVDSRENPLEKRKILENIYVGNLANNKGVDEIVEVFDWMSSVTTGQLYDRKVRDTIQAIAERDPERAKEFVLQMPIGNGRKNALGAIGSALAQRDPAEALAFANSLEFEEEKRQVLSNMSWRLARGDVLGASQMILASNDSLVEKQLGTRLVDEWSVYNREAAMDFASSLSDEEAKSNAIRSIVKNWMQSEPAEAMLFLETEITDQNKQRNYLKNAFNDWSRQDPAEAVKWLDALPESAEGTKADLYRDVARAYLNHDTYAASEWIGSLEEGEPRDRSVQALVDNIYRKDPESAFIWAETVSGKNLRKNTLERSVREWVKIDPDAAYEAVKDSKIEAAEKDPLFNMIEKQRN